jgi:hypothetical protein
MAATPSRNYNVGVFGVTFGGLNCGIVQSVKLSTIKREVQEAPVADKLYTQRSMGPPSLTPIEIEIALSGARQEVLSRFSAIFNQQSDNGGGAARFDGEISIGNTDGKCVKRQIFNSGIITAFSFGDLDVGGKGMPTFKVTIEPEEIQTIEGDNSKIQGNVDKQNKVWSAANFRVTAAGLPTADVSKVYNWNTKLSTHKQYTGEQRLPQLIPGALEFPKDGKIDFMSRSSKEWYDWYKAMNEEGDVTLEKDIVVEYLDSTLRKTLFTVTYHECGIADLTSPQFQNNKPDSALNTAVLYCDRISFQ